MSAAAAAAEERASDLLYTDLDLSHEDVQNHELRARLAEAQRRIQALEAKAALVGTECVQLRRENEVLRRNASSLYRTAKRELERKDGEIASLRERLLLLSGGAGGAGGSGRARGRPPGGGRS